MNDHDKSKEQLINELQELQRTHNSLKATIEADLLSHKIVEEKLRASEERFQLLFNKAPLGYQSLDFDGYFIEVNKQWLDTLGYQREEVIGKWFGDFLTPAYQDGFRKRFPVFKAQGQIHSEFEMLHKNGSVLFISFEGKIGYDSKGGFKQTHCILQDITENKRAENALRESEEKYRLLHENAGIGIGYYKVDGTIISYNNIAAKNMNGVPEDFNGKSIYDIFSKQIAEFYHERIKKAAVSEIPVAYEDEVSLPESSKYFLSTYTRIINVNGEIEGIQILSQDITDRKQAENEIFKISQHYQALIDKAPDGIALIDAERNFKFISPAAKKMFGYSQTDDVFGNPADYTHPDDLQMVLTELGKLFGDPTYVPTLEYRFIDKPGHWHWVETTFSNLLANPSVESIVLNFRDITERKRSEKAIRLSEEKFRKAFFTSPDSININRLKDGAFISINKGFTQIMGYTEDEVHRKTSIELNIWANADSRKKMSEELKSKGYVENLEAKFRKKDGTLVDALMSASMIELEGVPHILSITRDITQRKQAETELRQSEERYALVIEASEQGIWDWNVETNEVFYSEQWKKQIGYNDHELKNEFNTWVERLHPDESEYCQNALYSYINEPVEHFILDFRLRHKDGTYRWIHDKAASIKNNEGKVIRLFGTHTDITESKLSEAIFKDIIEKNPISIQILDMEGYPIQVNSAHTKLFGAKPPSDYSVLKDPQLLLLGFDKLFERIKKGEIVYFPDSYYNVHDVDQSFPDSPAWVKALGFTLNDNNGNSNKIVLMHENITEHKNAEVLLNDIIENNPMSIQVVDKEGYTLRGNPAFIELFGSVPPPEFSIFDDLIGKSAELENLVSRVKNGGIVHLPDIYFNTRDAYEEAPDIPLWIRALIFPLKDSSGKPQRFVFMHENITERKIAEQELIKAKEKAEESDHLKSAFLANMSHEIRTPMNGILGFAELLKQKNLSGEEQQEYISIIAKSGVRMLNIINDIVDISKIEAGLMNVHIVETDINEKIEFIYIFFKPQVEEKGMQIHFKNTLPAKEAVIRTDDEKVYSILTNLVKNAIKFSEGGSIELGYERKGNNIEIFVKDTGIGIPKERQEAIFERFIQADIYDKKARQGAGLGLSISKAYVEMLGGKIWVESEEGIGSTFYFTLPYNAEPDEKKVVGKADTAQNEKNQINPINPGVSGLKILIAEDDETSEILISINVKEFSREIIDVKTGNEAVEICRKNPDIDLILMDIQMPGLNGYEATRQIRQFDKNVIIIAQTAFGLSGDREKAIEAGCNDYIAKPINKDALIAIIKKQIHKKAN